jgi:hypothetical protein
MQASSVESSAKIPSSEAPRRAPRDASLEKGAFRARLQAGARRAAHDPAAGEVAARNTTRHRHGAAGARRPQLEGARGTGRDGGAANQHAASDTGRRSSAADASRAEAVETPSRRTLRERVREERDESALPADGVAFTPVPPILLPPSAVTTAAPASPRTAPAEMAALADRLLRGLRVGRLPDGSAMVRMQLDGGGRGDVHIELRQTEAGLSAIVETSDGDRARASAWADRLGAALGARGLDLRSIELA